MAKSIHCTQNTYFFPQLRHIVLAWFLVYGSEQCQNSCADPDITKKYFLPGTLHEPDLAVDADHYLCGFKHNRAWKRKELKGMQTGNDSHIILPSSMDIIRQASSADWGWWGCPTEMHHGGFSPEKQNWIPQEMINSGDGLWQTVALEQCALCVQNRASALPFFCWKGWLKPQELTEERASPFTSSKVNPRCKDSVKAAHLHKF